MTRYDRPERLNENEPTIGLHPLDVATLIDVLQRLIEQGATVVVIEHDLDMMANADYLIDMGPGGGEQGGRIVATGTPAEVATHPDSLTGAYLARGLTTGSCQGSPLETISARQ